MTATEDAPQSWLSRLLQFGRVGDTGDTFVIANSDRGPASRLFGGLIAAQALWAAGYTVDPAKHPQSLHLYFVRGGQYDVDIEFEVRRIRTGRSFDTRQVSARQGGEVILELIASFHRPEPGADWHPHPAPALDFTDARPKRTDLNFSDRFEIRTAPDDTSPFALPPYWIRSREPVGDDPLLSSCLLTFMSDLGPVPAVRPPGTPLSFDVGFATSLDHAIWFHRPFRPTEWHRYEVNRVNNSDSRGLAFGSLYDPAGALVASVTQEALWRL